MKIAIVLALGAVCGVLQTAPAEARTAYAAGRWLAAQRHYPEAKRDCFARVFAAHASRNAARRGWLVHEGRAYSSKLRKRCRIGL